MDSHTTYASTTHSCATLKDAEIVSVPDATILIIPISSAYENTSLITDDDRTYADKFLTTSKRRAEFFSWRALLRSHCGQITICYDLLGAPYIPDSDLHISVSHTSTHAAAIVSQERCAIDMESCRRNFSRAAGRFLHPQEKTLPQNEHRNFLPAVWCAKETMYKIAGRQGLDFASDLRVISIDIDEGTITGTIRHADDSYLSCDMHIYMYGSDTMIVWTAAEPIPLAKTR